MAASAGSFFSAYRLDLSGLATDIASAKRQLTDLRAFAAQPTTIGAAGGAAGAGGSGAGAGRAPAANAQAAADQRAANAALQLTSAEARLAAAQGNTAGALRTLNAGLDANAGASQRATLAVQTQAARLASGRSAYQQYGDAAKSAFLGIIGPAAVVAGAIRLVGEAGDLIKLGATAQGARVSFDNLAVSVGATGDALLGKLRAAAQGTVSDANLISSANSGILLTGGKLATELPRLLQIARASAQATGDDVGFVFDSLVKGIARGSPQIIDNAKITLDAEGAFKAYAASIGKTSDQLTRADQQQATLNAVLAAGTDIIAKTGGAAETNATSIARLGASWDNLKVKVGGALANVVAPAVEGANAVVTLGDRVQAVSGQTIAGATSFQNYGQRVTFVNQQLKQLDGLMGLIGLGTPKIQALSQAQFNYAQSLIRTGVAAAEAEAKARALNDTFIKVGNVQAVLAQRGGLSAAAIDQLANTILQLNAAGGEGAAQANSLTIAFFNGQLSAQQFATAIQQIGPALDIQAQAAANAAAMEAQRHGEQTAGAAATQTNTSAVEANAAALAEQTQKTIESALQGQQLAQIQNTLATLGGQVAQGLITAGQAAVAMGNMYGFARDQAILLINAQAQLAQAKMNAQAFSDQRVGERSGGAFSSANQLTVYSDGQRNLARLEEAAAKRGAGTRAGAGAAHISDQAKLNNTLAADQAKADDKAADMTRDHYRTLLKIQADFEQKSLEQQRANEVSKRQSRADFYDNLTSSSKELGQKESQALSAEYEQAYSKAQGIAQAGNQKLADDYLAMRQQQIQKEIEYQKARAAAAKEGDKGEVARLDAIRKLQVEADAEKEKQLLAGGDPNVKARDDALTQEGTRYDEAQSKIVTASDRATQAKITNALTSGKAIDVENLKLKAQADYYDRIRARSGGTAGATPATAPETPAPGTGAAPASAPAGGDQLWRVFDSAVVDAINAQTSQLSADLGAVKVAVEDVGRRVGAVESAVRSANGATR